MTESNAPNAPSPRADRWGRYLVLVQGSYFLLTGVWPVAHLGSFLAVTGPKTDLWLVQAFGLLVAAVGAALLSLPAADRTKAAAFRFGFATAAMLAFIDVWFVTRGAIPPVYLLDAVPETAIALAWLIVKRASRPNPRV